MAKAKKLPSGNWRTQVFAYKDRDGKSHYKSFTAETKSESEYLAAEFLKEKELNIRKMKNTSELTVIEAIDKYIELSDILSPTTLRGYHTIKKYAFQDIMNIQVKDLDDMAMQEAINREARRKNPQGRAISSKTVSNEWGLLSSALSTVCKVRFDIKLPKKVKRNKEYPDVALVFEAIRGTDIELPCLLAMWLSFSMSEVRGIKCSSVKSGIISIDRVMVEGEHGTVVKDVAKVDTRIRKHQIPDYIMNLINATDTYKRFLDTGNDEFLIPATRNMIYHKLTRLGDANGFEISFHDLRHLNASVMLMLNIPSKYAMERGGWKTDHVLKTVYQHTFSSERKLVDEKVNNFFESLIENKD